MPSNCVPDGVVCALRCPVSVLRWLYFRHSGSAVSVKPMACWLGRQRRHSPRFAPPHEVHCLPKYTQPADVPSQRIPERTYLLGTFFGAPKNFSREPPLLGRLRRGTRFPKITAAGDRVRQREFFGDTCLGKGPNTEPEVLYFLRLFRYLRHPAVPRNHRLYCVRFRTPRSSRFFACAAFSSVHLLSWLPGAFRVPARCTLPLFRPRFLKGGAG